MLQPGQSGEQPGEPPSGQGHQAKPKWAALVNDVVIVVPQEQISAKLLRNQVSIPADLVLIRDHNSPEDTVVQDDDLIDLVEGNVFYTMKRDQVGRRGSCNVPAKLAYFIDDRPEVTTNPAQTGESLRDWFGLDATSRLLRDYESPVDETIAPNDSAGYSAGPVFVTRQAVPITIVVNGKRRRVTGDRVNFNQLVSLAFDSPPTGENICFTITYRGGPCENPQGSLVEGQTVFITEGMVFNVTATDKS